MDPFAKQFEEGLQLFNQGEFYECHDVLEEIWLQESSDRQPLLQGLIQAAVTFHHYQHGKLGAARSMVKLALEKLSRYPDQVEGIELELLRRDLTAWRRFLESAIRRPEAGAAPPARPRIRRAGE